MTLVMAEAGRIWTSEGDAPDSRGRNPSRPGPGLRTRWIVADRVSRLPLLVLLLGAAGFAPPLAAQALPIVNASFDASWNGCSHDEVRADRADVVFVDGFEAGSACRWSGSGP
jgi:hypothetical protein